MVQGSVSTIALDLYQFPGILAIHMTFKDPSKKYLSIAGLDLT